MDDVKDRWMNTYKDHRRDGQMDSMGNRQTITGQTHGENCNKVERN